MLAAADTFRAAAIEQLKIWGERTGAPWCRASRAPMPRALAFDACRRAKDEGYDVLFIDTAGRLQNKTGLDGGAGKGHRVLQEDR